MAFIERLRLDTAGPFVPRVGGASCDAAVSCGRRLADDFKISSRVLHVDEGVFCASRLKECEDPPSRDEWVIYAKGVKRSDLKRKYIFLSL